MQVVILAGGLGTRLGEETDVKPKPMVDIGGQPILRHIMHGYADYGFTSFVIALGYKGDVVKRYFLDEANMSGDLDIDLAKSTATRSRRAQLDWRVQLIETGATAQTGTRLRRAAHAIDGDTFFLTYGDGVSNIDLNALLAFHNAHGKKATLTAVRPPARFGALDLDGDNVRRFEEKPQAGEGWINGGFMVLSKSVVDIIDAHGGDPDDVVLERDVLAPLAALGELAAFRHTGFWQCMDTLRDVRLLRDLAAKEKPPWRR